MQNYLQLEKEIEEINQINNVVDILSWDIAVNMPIGSAESRTNEISLLSSIIHSRLKSNKINDLINAVDTETSQLNAWQSVNLQEIKRKVLYISCVSDDLQKRYITAATKSELVWREARKDNDFNKLKPYFQEVLDCVQELAGAKASLLNCTKYDALLDEYDPSRKTTDLKQIFTNLKTVLPDLTKQIVDKQKTEMVLPINEVPIEQQKLIGRKIMEVMGFDFTRGRIDDSTHPFCGGTAFDVRITNRYKTDDFISGIMGIVHETGHALYEQNLPANYKNQLVGKAKGMAIHESQSLLMEMQVGRSKEFCEFLSKLLNDEFGLKGQEYSADNLYKLNTRVRPSLIRVDADEVTYPMHVMLRFEIEELLINKELTLNDIPDFWNKKMQEYLGVVPNTNSEGCLQDIHWPSGSFGYFPAYTCGAIIASMLMEGARKSAITIDADITMGNFNSINEFLNNRVRNFGSLKTTKDLIKDATGENKIKPEIFLKYLKQKYLN
ncbi:MAG: carboxypeptidase M32 [Rickettsiaceae bacterium]|nr:carboxypeptidase M32 [Rickettsiaceae bacterium]